MWASRNSWAILVLKIDSYKYFLLDNSTIVYHKLLQTANGSGG